MPRRMMHASNAGARRSTAKTSCSSTVQDAATATTTRPWLVGEDVPVGALVRVRGAAVSEEGILAA